MSALGLRCPAACALLGMLRCTRPVTQRVVVVSLSAARRGTATSVEWVSDSELHGVSFTD